MEEFNTIELTNEEKEIIRTYQDNISGMKSAFGTLRQRYVASEQKAIESITKAESDYISYITTLSQSKNMNVDSEKWVFDPEELVFRKMSQ